MFEKVAVFLTVWIIRSSSKFLQCGVVVWCWIVSPCKFSLQKIHPGILATKFHPGTADTVDTLCVGSVNCAPGIQSVNCVNCDFGVAIPPLLAHFRNSDFVFQACWSELIRFSNFLGLILSRSYTAKVSWTGQLYFADCFWAISWWLTDCAEAFPHEQGFGKRTCSTPQNWQKDIDWEYHKTNI